MKCTLWKRITSRRSRKGISMEPFMVVAGIVGLIVGLWMHGVLSEARMELIELRDEIDKLVDENAKVRDSVARLKDSP